MCHTASDATELAKRLFAATMARADLGHILFGAFHLKLNKTLHCVVYQ